MSVFRFVTRSAVLVTFFAGAMVSASSAQAVVIDFAQYAEDNGEASVGEAKAASYANPLPVDPVNNPVAGLVLSAVGGVPYLDGYSGGRRAGLGVCGTTNAGAQCTPSSDDNITAGESVTISLTGGQHFDFRAVEFRDSDHFDISGSLFNLLISTDGGAALATTFSAVVATSFMDIGSITFWFGGGENANQFYLAAADIRRISEPGTFTLLGVALVGLGLARRKRAAQTSPPRGVHP